MPVARRSGSGGAIPTVVSVNDALKTATEFRAAAAQFAAQKQAERADFELMKKELEAKFEAKQLLLTQQEEAHRARAEELDAETAKAEQIERFKRCKRKAKDSAAVPPPRLSCNQRRSVCATKLLDARVALGHFAPRKNPTTKHAFLEELKCQLAIDSSGGIADWSFFSVKSNVSGSCDPCHNAKKKLRLETSASDDAATDAYKRAETIGRKCAGPFCKGHKFTEKTYKAATQQHLEPDEKPRREFTSRDGTVHNQPVSWSMERGLIKEIENIKDGTTIWLCALCNQVDGNNRQIAKSNEDARKGLIYRGMDEKKAATPEEREKIIDAKRHYKNKQQNYALVNEIKARIGQCKDCGLKVTAKNRMGMHFAHHKATEYLKWRSPCGTDSGVSGACRHLRPESAKPVILKETHEDRSFLKCANCHLVNDTNPRWGR
jgi:uncharacterized protein YaiL (DUF2058 family)